MCAPTFDMRWLRYGQTSITLAAKHDSSQPESLDLSVFYPDLIRHDIKKLIMSEAAI